MQIIEFNKRIIHKNPIEPYSWEAKYKDGGIKQFDFDGYHKSAEIDCSRIAELIILGHSDSPIIMPKPIPELTPDEIIIKATVDLIETIRGNEKTLDRSVRYYFGYRFGQDKFLIEIDELGRIFKTNHELGV